MEEDTKTLSDYVSIAWRRKFHILIPAILVLFITIPTVLMLPPVYLSTGTILIESQQIPEELVQSMVTSFADERIQVIETRIMSGDRLYEIIKKFDLYAEEIKSTARSEILTDMRDRVAIDLVSANVKSRNRRASATIAFTISFEHRNAGTAQKVANELVTLFLDENIKVRTARAEETSEFMKKESERLGSQIALMEEQIASYKQENKGSLPDNLAVNLQRIVDLKSSLLATDAEMNGLNGQRNLLLIDLETLELKVAVSGGLTEEQLQQKQELQNLQNQYISLSARYGPKHPDVKSIKRQISAFEDEYGNLSNIEELKTQEQGVKQELLELTRKYSSEHPDVKKLERKLDGIVTMIAEFDSAGEVPEVIAVNPELLQIKAKLGSVDSSIARIKKARLEHQRQIAALDTQISRTPQVERGLEALERDSENTRGKYQEMKSKELQAELSRSLEEDQKGERFTLLEPPLFPDKPIKPDRKKLFMFGLILAIISGIGVAGFAESLDGGIRGARALASVTKMTPLVTIPYITTRKDEAIKKRNLKIWIATIILLGISFIAMVHLFYKPLDLVWLILLRKLNLT
jgi:succinoglycan biosynthesis transport protein ExoP